MEWLAGRLHHDNLVDQKICKKRHFTISNFLMNFHKCHALHYARLSQAMLSQVSRKMGFKNARACAQKAKNSFFNFDSFRAIPQ
jgi:hypothetical protein